MLGLYSNRKLTFLSGDILHLAETRSSISLKKTQTQYDILLNEKIFMLHICRTSLGRISEL